MKRAILSFYCFVFALLLALVNPSPSPAWYVGGGELQGFNVGGSNPSISFVACTSSTSDLTTYTFSSHSLGTEGNRTTIVGVFGHDSAANDFSVSSVTVAGNAATEQYDYPVAQSYQLEVALYTISNPTGATGDIVVTFSEGINTATVCV